MAAFETLKVTLDVIPFLEALETTGTALLDAAASLRLKYGEEELPPVGGTDCGDDR